jgi:hypothetical protein
MFAGLDVGGKTTAICIVDEAAKIVWRGMADTHPDCDSPTLEGFSGKACQGWDRERAVHAASVSVPCRHGLSDGVHGCAAGGGCNQKPADQIGQGGCLGFGRDAADRLVQRSPREVGREPQDQDTAWSARSACEGEALAWQSGAGPVAAFRLRGREIKAGPSRLEAQEKERSLARLKSLDGA